MLVDTGLVSSHPAAAQGLFDSLTKDGLSVAQFEWGAGICALAESVMERNPRSVILDLAGEFGVDPGRLRIITCMRKVRPNLPVIAWGLRDADLCTRATAYCAGAHYMDRSLSAAGYISFVRNAIDGKAVDVEGLITPFPAELLESGMNLTKRELDVLGQLMEGRTNKQIGKILGISYETVKEHVQHVLRKLGVSDRTKAAVWAARRELPRRAPHRSTA